MIRIGTFFLLALLALSAVAIALDEMPMEGDLTEQNDIAEDMDVADRSSYPYYRKGHHGHHKRHHGHKRHHKRHNKPYYY